MSVAGIVAIVAFASSAFIAVAGALGMATTMSMFRSAIFLMASFMGVAGLFILRSADLLGLMSLLMYIGGMVVMALFMVLFMPDPGGAMMAAMPEMMTPIGRFFSLGLLPENSHAAAAEMSGAHAEHDTHADHGGGHGTHARHQDAEHQRGRERKEGDDAHGGRDHHAHGAQGGSHAVGHMDMSDMSMETPVPAWAAWPAVATRRVIAALPFLPPTSPTSSP